MDMGGVPGCWVGPSSAASQRMARAPQTALTDARLPLQLQRTLRHGGNRFAGQRNSDRPPRAAAHLNQGMLWRGRSRHGPRENSATLPGVLHDHAAHRS